MSMRKLPEHARENQTHLFSSGWAFSFRCPPQIPYSLRLNHKTKNIIGLSPTLFPHPTPALFLSFLSVFLSLEPSERQLGARFPPFLTIGH